MLDSGRLDGVILTDITLDIVFTKLDQSVQEKLYTKTLVTHKLYHYVHKKNKEIVPLLDKALVEMKRSGEINKIKSKFLIKKSVGIISSHTKSKAPFDTLDPKI